MRVNPAYLLKNHSRGVLFFGIFWICCETQADALGVSNSIEIAKLTEIITQMDALVTRTQKYIDLQRRLAETQERVFFRKSKFYAHEVRKLASATSQLQESWDSLTTDPDPFKLQAIYKDIEDIRKKAATIPQGNTRESLYKLADVLDQIAQAKWLTGTANQALQESARSKEANTQEQLLSALYRTLAGMHEHNTAEETRHQMQSLAAHQKMLGMYSSFKLQTQ